MPSLKVFVPVTRIIIGRAIAPAAFAVGKGDDLIKWITDGVKAEVVKDEPTPKN